MCNDITDYPGNKLTFVDLWMKSMVSFICAGRPNLC